MFGDTIVFDFDGVIHSYKSGWKGTTIIPDPVVPGIKLVIDTLRSEGYHVVVVSSRCSHPEGISAIRKYLSDNDIVVDDIMSGKPPALCYIDDRAIRFTGQTDTLLDEIKNFKPWQFEEKEKMNND